MLLRLLAGIVILIGLFQLVPAQQVFDELRHAEAWWLVAGFLLALLVQWIVSVRLCMLANVHGLGLSNRSVFQINLATRFYGLVVPGGMVSTMAIRSFKLGDAKTGYVGPVAAVAFDRVLATLTLCVVGIVFWMLDWPPHSRIWLIVMATTFLGISAIVLLLASTVFSTSAGQRSELQLGFGARRLARIQRALLQARSMKRSQLIWAIALSVLAHLIATAAHVCIAASLRMDVDFATLGWVRTTMVLASMIPISLAGLGLREGAALMTLTALGIGADVAVAFALLLGVVTMLGVGLVGGLLEAYHLVCGKASA